MVFGQPLTTPIDAYPNWETTHTYWTDSSFAVNRPDVPFQNLNAIRPPFPSRQHLRRGLALLSAFFMACASAPPPSPEVALARRRCMPAPEFMGRSAAELQNLLGRQRGQFVLSAGAPYVCECGARGLGGDIESRHLAGTVEQRGVSGSIETRDIAGDSEARRIGGDSEARRLAGAQEQRLFEGDLEKRSFGGGTEQRSLGADAEERRLEGAAETRRLGGGGEVLTCGSAAGCAGFVVSGRGALHFIENGQFVDAHNRCVE